MDTILKNVDIDPTPFCKHCEKTGHLWGNCPDRMEGIPATRAYLRTGYVVPLYSTRLVEAQQAERRREQKREHMKRKRNA